MKLKICLNLIITMKNLLTLVALLLFALGSAQTSNVSYTSSSALFSNPDRGFYKFTSTTSSGSYSPLNQTTLTNYRINDNITLIYREFRLEAFVTGSISSSYLANMQSDFDKLRNAGIKAIIRFTYSEDKDTSPRDATKAVILNHLQQLRPILQANGDVISLMQAGFIGVWGEWYYTSQAEFGGGGYSGGGSLTSTNTANRREVIDAMLAASPPGMMTQLRTPTFKQALYSSTPLADSQAFNGTAVARVGHFNDCFLASADDYGTYSNTSTQYPYLEQETKYLPMGGETCALNSPRSDCASAVTEMTRFHWSFLNADYNTSVLGSWSSCMTDVKQKLGYRFALTSATFPNSAATNSTMAVTIKLRNNGYAAPFNKRNVYLVLKNLTTNQVYPILMNADPRRWLGTNEITVTENLTLPSGVTTGNYKLYLHVPDASASIANRPEYAIRFANSSVWESTTGYNDLNYTLSVTGGSLATTDHSKLNLTIYPVPTDGELFIEMEHISDYKVLVYNSLGQIVSVKNVFEPNKVKLFTDSLSEGLYFVEFTKGNEKDSRKIIVKHH